MEYNIRKVKFKEMDVAFSLIWRTFLEFIAPDYNEEGIDTFHNNFIESDDFKLLFKTGVQTMLGAYVDDKLVGEISISVNNHVSCIFVDKDYHRKGIATALFNKMVSGLKRKGIEKIALNASPYAVPFYHAMGFVDTDIEQEFKGIRYTPMEFIIKNPADLKNYLT